jgi:hypothetical protein
VEVSVRTIERVLAEKEIPQSVGPRKHHHAG